MYFTSGLSDVTAIIGTDAELVCRLSNEECDGVWYKEGKEVRTAKKADWWRLTPFKTLSRVYICVLSDNSNRQYLHCERSDLSQANYQKLHRG